MKTFRLTDDVGDADDVWQAFWTYTRPAELLVSPRRDGAAHVLDDASPHVVCAGAAAATTKRVVGMGAAVRTPFGSLHWQGDTDGMLDLIGLSIEAPASVPGENAGVFLEGISGARFRALLPRTKLKVSPLTTFGAQAPDNDLTLRMIDAPVGALHLESPGELTSLPNLNLRATIKQSSSPAGPNLFRSSVPLVRSTIHLDIDATHAEPNPASGEDPFADYGDDPAAAAVVYFEDNDSGSPLLSGSAASIGIAGPSGGNGGVAVWLDKIDLLGGDVDPGEWSMSVDIANPYHYAVVSGDQTSALGEYRLGFGVQTPPVEKVWCPDGALTANTNR